MIIPRPQFEPLSIQMNASPKNESLLDWPAAAAASIFFFPQLKIF